MTAILKVDTIQDTSGNNIINESSDTITIGASGDTTNIVGTLQNNGSALVTGKVLQVVQGTKTDSTLSTSASYVATGLNVNITPSATSSKVLIMVSSYIDSNASTVQVYTTIYRDSTDLDSSGTGGLTSAYNGGGRLRSATNMSILDSPNTTSQITYEMYMRNASGANIQINSESGTVTIIAMEIGA